MTNAIFLRSNTGLRSNIGIWPTRERRRAMICISLTRNRDLTNFHASREPTPVITRRTRTHHHGYIDLNNSLRTWFGEVTTGHGFMIIGSTLLAALSGSMTWATAAPLLVAGGIGLIWPENTALQSATRAAAADVTSMVSAYMNTAVPPAPGLSSTGQPPDVQSSNGRAAK